MLPPQHGLRSDAGEQLRRGCLICKEFADAVWRGFPKIDVSPKSCDYPQDICLEGFGTHQLQPDPTNPPQLRSFSLNLRCLKMKAIIGWVRIDGPAQVGRLVPNGSIKHCSIDFSGWYKWMVPWESIGDNC